VNARDVNSFAQVARELTGTLVEVIAAAKQEQLPTAAAARTLGHAALVQYLGRATETQAPRDVIAWVVDKDLLDPALVSIEPRLLINKRELDELEKVLKDVMTAGMSAQVSGRDFFTALQASACLCCCGRIRQVQSMAELVPEFLLGLPYKSPLMALTPSLWASWTEQQQNEFLEGIEARIHLYQTMLDASDKWVSLHAGDAPDEFVYPISLDSLP
jgi:serine/threonine-protein kinase PpkA